MQERASLAASSSSKAVAVAEVIVRQRHGSRDLFNRKIGLGENQ